MWAALRAATSWVSTHEMGIELEIEQRAAARILRAWFKAGIVAVGWERDRSNRKTVRYLLGQDMGPVPPRVSADGRRQTRSAQQRMWDVMPVLKQFRPLDLALHAQGDGPKIAEETARRWCTWLVKAGYLTRRDGTFRVIQEARQGRPVAPKIIKTTGVFDPNTGSWPYDGEDQEVAP